MKKIILMIILLFSITGCTYRELNELAIGDAIGIDYIDGKYLITIQILNLKKQSGEETTEKAILYEGEGDTIALAIRNMNKNYPKNIYLGHLKLMIFGKGAVENGIEKTFDYFLRSPEIRSDADVIINPYGTAFELLNPDKNKTESFPSDEIKSMVETTMQKQGNAIKINFEEFISLYIQKGICPVASGIALKEDKAVLTGIVAIDKEKNIYELNEQSAMAFNIINQNFYDIVVKTNYEGTTLDLIVGIPKSKIDLKIEENKIKVNINLELKSQVGSLEKDVNLEDPKVQSAIQEDIDKTIKSYANNLINFCKENNVDILGLKNMIYKKYHKDYNKYKDLNIYKEADINIKTNVKVYRFGTIYRSASGE